MRSASQVSVVQDRSASTEPSQNVLPTVTRPQASLADVDDSDRTPSKASSLPRKQEKLEGGSTALKSLSGRGSMERPGQPASANGIASDRGLPSPGIDQPDGTPSRQIASNRPSTSEAHPRASNESLPDNRKQRRARAREANSRELRAADRHTQAPQQPGRPSPASTAASRATTSSAALDHSAWLIKRIERDQRRLKDEWASSRREQGAEREDAFREFASAWGEMKPGGAFAKPAGGGTGNQRGRRLDVLGWEL